MTTAATRGFGTLLKRNGTTVAEARDITGPGMSRETVDVTTHDSTGGWREYIAGALSGGEVSFDCNFLPANATQSYAAGLIKDMVDGTLQTFTLQYTDTGTTTASFSAFVTAFTPKAPVEGLLSASVTLKISGAVSFA